MYGRTKLAGERAIEASGCRHLIFRTSWIYSAHGANFPKTILRLAKERTEIRVVDDQVGAPTGADLIADVTALALQRMHANSGLAARAGGLYHLAAGGAASWHRYARFLIELALQAGIELRTTPDRVLPVSSAEYGAVAPRPANSRLDTAKLRDAFGLTLPPWEEGIRRLVAQLRESSSKAEKT